MIEAVPLETPRAAVLGYPVEHSLSPLLHMHWLETLGLKGHYGAIAIAPDAFSTDVPALFAAGYRGFNVTIPHKHSALDIADVLTDRARHIGAVNTLWRDGQIIRGDSTDGDGFMAALPPLSAGSEVVMIGAGGAAKSIGYALASEETVLKITIANRTREKAEILAAHLRPLFPQTVFDTAAVDALTLALPDASLIVNTTSLGMVGQPPLMLDLGPCKRRPIVYDIVYTPAETPLLKAASLEGFTAINGLDMLIGQGRPGFEKWFGAPAPHTGQEREVLIQALSQT